jgi:serine phosphatase RsbU (regulator of sigma subunit)
MHEVEPDKVPIGYHSYTEIERFTTTRIAWQRGDIFYAFSDGYGDQFGGERGRKFMVKNLKDLLLKHHADPTSRQRDVLSQTIEAWRGGRPQIDDILVMGIRV